MNWRRFFTILHSPSSTISGLNEHEPGRFIVWGSSAGTGFRMGIIGFLKSLFLVRRCDSQVFGLAPCKAIKTLVEALRLSSSGL